MLKIQKYLGPQIQTLAKQTSIGKIQLTVISLSNVASPKTIKREPPRGKLLSSLKVELEPNDDKMFLFGDPRCSNKNVAVVSPIRQHIQRIDDSLRFRLSQSFVRKSRSLTSIVDNNNHNSKRFQRMRFMGIPVPSSLERKSSGIDLKAIVASVSRTSTLPRGNSSKDSRSTSRLPSKKTQASPEAVKLEPKVPEFDYTDEEIRESSRVDKFVPFAKAQPRGTNAKNLRVDKSLPWIQDDLDAARTQIKDGADERKSFAVGNPDLEMEIKRKEKNPIQSAIKESFIEVIASKLLAHKAQDDFEEPKCEDVGEMQSAVESKSSLSSAGTYFTNDSGSLVVLNDQRIPKSEMNVQKKFQVS